MELGGQYHRISRVKNSQFLLASDFYLRIDKKT